MRPSSRSSLSLRRPTRHGAAAIEFALVCVIFFMLVFAIINWGWLISSRANVQTSAVIAARAGALISPSATPTAPQVAVLRAKDALENFNLDAQSATVTATITGVSPNKTLDVTITLPYTAPIVAMNLVTPSSITATMSAHMETQ